MKELKVARYLGGYYITEDSVSLLHLFPHF